MLLYCKVVWFTSLPLVFCGFTSSFLSTRVNISHLCRRYLDWRFAGMYNMMVLTLNSYLHWFNQEKMLIACMIVLIIMYTWYVLTVMTQIKNHLGIHALHLGKNEKKE